MPDFENGFSGETLFFLEKEGGEKIPFSDLTSAELVDADNINYEEDGNKIIATISNDVEFTLTAEQTNKQARKTYQFFHAMFNRQKRRIRSWYRTKERLRRARLKGKEYIRISPRICGWLQHHQLNEGEK